MIARPFYVAEKVPAKFIGGRFHSWEWRVVLVDQAGRHPTGKSTDGHGWRYRTQREALEAARSMNGLLAQSRVPA